MSKRADECEMRDGREGWTIIPISLALKLRGEDMRCPECHGRMRPHREYSDGARAHFEHQTAHSGCSTKPKTFVGTQSLHPEALV